MICHPLPFIPKPRDSKYSYLSKFLIENYSDYERLTQWARCLLENRNWGSGPLDQSQDGNTSVEEQFVITFLPSYQIEMRAFGRFIDKARNFQSNFELPTPIRFQTTSQPRIKIFRKWAG